MPNSMLNNLGFDPAILIFALAGLVVVLLIMVMVLMKKQNELYRKYDLFMRGKDAESLEDKDLQLQAAQTIIDKNLSVRETEKLVKNLLEPAVKKEKPELAGQAIYRDIEKKLKNQLGTKVAINRKDENQGRIEISYYSVDELERILELLDKAQ